MLVDNGMMYNDDPLRSCSTSRYSLNLESTRKLILKAKKLMIFEQAFSFRTKLLVINLLNRQAQKAKEENETRKQSTASYNTAS